MTEGPTGKVAPRRRQRRKAARPSEITEAALALFAEKGFGATKMEEVARRAGVAKGTLFVYFPTKEDLFRAAARRILEINLDPLLQAMARDERPVGVLIPALLGQAALIGDTQIPSIVRLLIADARTFPDLARVWYDEVVSKVLGHITALIERGQANGEVRPGDARLYAFSIIGPMLASVLFREVFKDTEAPLPDLHKLAAQHADTIVAGLTD